MAGLKKETGRQILRAFKKVGKAEEKLRKALEKESGPADDLQAMETEVMCACVFVSIMYVRVYPFM